MAATPSGTTKEQLPTLAGKRIKTRKRDEKVKHDPNAFAEQLIMGLNETDGSLEEIAKYLDTMGGQMDYRRYAEELLDILIAGGQLAPGGKIESPFRASVCVFTCEPMVEALKEHVQVMTKLVRQRYKYLQKSLQEDMTKILKFLKGFDDEQRRSLAIFTALCLAETLIPASILVSLLTGEMIVKEGLSLEFSTIMFQTWIKEKGISHVGSALRKASIENRLLEFLPPTKQTASHFNDHFTRKKLEVLVRFRQVQENSSYKQKLKEELIDLISQEVGSEEIVDKCQQHMSTTSLGNVDICVLLWQCIMASVEWNKKEELVAEQALKFLKDYCPLFMPFCEQGTPQLTLLLKIQDYCYINMNFMKSFHKIVLLFYKNDVISEQAILKWYNESHLQKGKSVFLLQMKPMVDWLLTAEEESDLGTVATQATDS